MTEPDSNSQAFLEATQALFTPPVETFRCCRCRNSHLETERVYVRAKDGWKDSTCPRCGAKSYTIKKP